MGGESIPAPTREDDRQPWAVRRRDQPGQYTRSILQAGSAEHKRGQALGFYVHCSESGKPGDFTGSMTGEEIDRELAKLMTELAISQAKRSDQEPNQGA